MGRRKRDGQLRVLYAEVPPLLVDKLDIRARNNNRSRTQELITILEEVLAEPSAKKPEAAP